MFQDSSAAVFQNNLAELFLNKTARVSQDSSVEMYLDNSARMFPVNNVVKYQDSNVEVYQGNSARMYPGNSAILFQDKNVTKSAKTFSGARFAVKSLEIPSANTPIKNLNTLPFYR